MRRAIRSLIRHVVGWGFVVLGIVGLVLPVLQGLLFIAIGLLLLSPDIPAFARFLSWVERRFPRLRSLIQSARGRIGGQDPPRGTPPAGP